jgi:hypothetical protein
MQFRVCRSIVWRTFERWKNGMVLDKKYHPAMMMMAPIADANITSTIVNP